jgi:hypothetical protein
MMGILDSNVLAEEMVVLDRRLFIVTAAAIGFISAFVIKQQLLPDNAIRRPLTIIDLPPNPRAMKYHWVGPKYHGVGLRSNIPFSYAFYFKIEVLDEIHSQYH